MEPNICRFGNSLAAWNLVVAATQKAVGRTKYKERPIKDKLAVLCRLFNRLLLVVNHSMLENSNAMAMEQVCLGNVY